jgi:hypothetical protein
MNRRGWLAGSALASACSLEFSEQDVDGLRLVQAEANANSAGRLGFVVPVEAGETAFLSNVRSVSGTRLYTERLEDGAGDLYVASDWWESERSYTNGAFAAATTSLNWPIDDDLPLTDDMHLDIASEEPGDALELSVFLGRSDFGGGRLPVTITFCGRNAGDAALAAAVDDAIEVWRGIYAPLGVTLDVAFADYPDASVLGPPGRGDDGAHWLALSEAGGVGRVNVALVTEIAEWDQAFGVAGDIPGPLIASERSGVAVGMSAAAGTNGRFEDAEIRLLGETFAHEVGHYLGLFHPVEIPLDATPISHWDGIDDTPECAGVSDCETEMASNLMFPYPVCGLSGRCAAQAEVTAGQEAAMKRYVGIRP